MNSGQQSSLSACEAWMIFFIWLLFVSVFRQCYPQFYQKALDDIKYLCTPLLSPLLGFSPRAQNNVQHTCHFVGTQGWINLTIDLSSHIKECGQTARKRIQGRCALERQARRWRCKWLTIDGRSDSDPFVDLRFAFSMEVLSCLSSVKKRAQGKWMRDWSCFPEWRSAATKQQRIQGLWSDVSKSAYGCNSVNYTIR